MTEQLTFWSVGAPDRSIYLQADGRFMPVDKADDSAIPYSIACAEWQQRWPRTEDGGVGERR